MPALLTRDEIVACGVDDFFLRLNARDLPGVMRGLAEDCVMRIPSSGFLYEGKAAIERHLDDFMRTFPVIHFRDFNIVADPVARRLAVHFNVSLTDTAAEQTHMSNANFFEVGEDGRLSDILIFASAPLSKGFEVGAANTSD